MEQISGEQTHHRFITNHGLGTRKTQQASSLAVQKNERSQRKTSDGRSRVVGGRARGRGRPEARGPSMTNETHATRVDHLMNHGLTDFI